MSKKAKDIYKVKTLEVLADKGYFDSNDIHQCEREEIITYVSKPCYSNGIGDSRYFSEKFKYDNKLILIFVLKETDYILLQGKKIQRLKNIIIQKFVIDVLIKVNVLKLKMESN